MLRAGENGTAGRSARGVRDLPPRTAHQPFSKLSMRLLLRCSARGRARSPPGSPGSAGRKVGTRDRVQSHHQLDDSGGLLTPVAKDKPPKADKDRRPEFDRLHRAGPSDRTQGGRLQGPPGVREDRLPEDGRRPDRRDDAAPAVNRVVVMKKGPRKAPFSPDGPLLWGEIDLLRADIVSRPRGDFCRTSPVQTGDTWKASAAAVAELTDIEKVGRRD